MLSKIKVVLLTMLFLVSTGTYAVQDKPDIWTVATANGWSEYNITSDTGTTVTLLCNNSTFVEEDYDPGHDIKVTLPNGKVNTIRENPDIISFVSRGEKHTPPGSLGWPVVNTYWEEVVESLTVGDSFDVYIKSKKMATINPNMRSVKKIFGNKKICIVR